jgi:hypothetical protein
VQTESFSEAAASRGEDRNHQSKALTGGDTSYSESQLFKELDELVRLHESGEDFIQYIKSRKANNMKLTRSKLSLQLS